MPIQTDRYEVIETLGTGATSRVDKVHDTVIGRTVAQKTFLNGFGSRALEEQFIREAQIVGRLAHPFIVGLYDVGTNATGLPCLIMEYVEGETLEKVLESAPLPLKRAAAWGGDLASALAQAHAAEIIHGDVKPANILVTKDGHVKLGDFGIARYATHISHSGDLKGTPAYLAPEQILDEPQDARSDLFSLGIILYQMATGLRPFDGNSLEAVCAQIISATPVPPSCHNPALPPEFDQIVMRCLAKDPAARFATAQDLAASLYPLARANSNDLHPSPASGTVLLDSPETKIKMAVGATSEAAVAVLHWLARRPSEKTTGNCKTLWWNRPVRRRDVWVAGAAAAILLISLVPLTRSLRRYSSLKAAANAQAASIASAAPNTNATLSSTSVSAIPVDSPAPSTSSPAKAVPGDNPSPEPAKPASPPRSLSHLAANSSRINLKTLAAGNTPAGNSTTGAKGESDSKAPKTSAPQQTSLRVAVVSDVVDDTLAVYSDDDLILKTALEAAHRGDTLRFSCPIATGDHFLRVILYRGDKEVLVHKENNSELRADGSNTMEVHVNRRSKMLVKHETSLEIVWPSRTLSSVISNGAELESGAAPMPR